MTTCFKDIANMKDGYTHHFDPISAYEVMNRNDHFLTFYSKGNDIRPNTTAYISKINHNNLNSLENKVNLSKINNKDLMLLKDNLSRNNLNIPLNTLKSAFTSPTEITYPKYYLPTKANGGLFNNPFPPVVSRKKKAQSKKK